MNVQKNSGTIAMMAHKFLSRSPKGSLIVITAALAFLILLPLGLYAFEVARIHLCQHQLAVVTDSAALAGATYLSSTEGSSTDDAQALSDAKNQALLYVQRNVAAGYPLTTAQISTSVDQDTPLKGASTFDLLYDKDTKVVTAKATVGVEPFFGRFLGIGVVPVRAHSSAGCLPLQGDIILAVDLSRSMGFASKSVWVKRTYDPVADKLSYSIIKRLGTANANKDTLPAFPNSRTDVLPDPDFADFSQSEKMQNLKNASPEAKLAALAIAKEGNLESQGAFESSHSDKSDLGSNLTPGPGFQDDFQRLALGTTQPLADAKASIASFVKQISQIKNTHFGLITFSSGVSPASDRKNTYSSRDGFALPTVALNSDSARDQDVMSALGPSPCFDETNYADTINAATAMLNGPGHRAAVQKSIILLTDGRPNQPGGSFNLGLKAAITAAKSAGQQGIRIFAVGFFHTSYSNDELANGPKALEAIVAAAGNGSKAYVAPNVPALKEVLSQIANSDVALINP